MEESATKTDSKGAKFVPCETPLEVLSKVAALTSTNHCGDCPRRGQIFWWFWGKKTDIKWTFKGIFDITIARVFMDM